MKPRIDQTRDGAVLSVRVQPRARREGIAGVHDGALKVALRAPPVDGAANAALVKFLGAACGVPARSVHIIGGQSARSKRVLFEALDAESLARRLEDA